MAGIASRSQCGRGPAIYIATAPYSSWIYETAPEAVPFSLGGGSGGCSAQRTGSSDPPSWLICAFGVLLIARSRRQPGMCAAPFLLITMACGSGGDSSFCVERYDPTGQLCNPGHERIELRTAEALARADLPDDALLLQALSSSAAVMDPDGAVNTWSFLYYLPGRVEPPAGMMIQTRATSSGTEPFPPERVEPLLKCIPSEPVPAIDSRRLIHDAIRFLESNGEPVVLTDGGNLSVVMSHVCLAWSSQPLNYVHYRGKALAYDDQGTFYAISERGPRRSGFRGVGRK